jgi:hypothetical protein
MKKKKKGTSPKGAVILREREKQHLRDLPPEPYRPSQKTTRKSRNPITDLISEFPIVPITNIELVVDPDFKERMNAALLEVRGGKPSKPCQAYKLTYLTHPETDEVKHDKPKSN